MLKISLWRIQEVTCHAIVFGFAIANLFDPLPIQAQENSPGVAQDNRRMRSDKKLRMPGSFEIVNDF